jgi:molecular chaperone DnaK
LSRLFKEPDFFPSEIERLVKYAEMHAEEDRRKKALVDARNQADARVYTSEKILNEIGGRLDPADRSRVETVISDLKKAMSGNDAQEIQRLSEEPERISHATAQSLYGKSSTGGSSEFAGAIHKSLVSAKVSGDIL